MALEQVTVCPVCLGAQFSSYLTCTDHTTSGETFNIVQCKSCSLLITTPRPDSSSLGSYYKSDQYISHTGGSATLADRLYVFVRKFTLNWKSKLISGSTPDKGSLLDFGCGTGEFLNQISATGWKGFGVEPSENARTKAKSLTGVNIHSSLQEITHQKFDAITLWHVLEHIPDLQHTLTKLVHCLKPNGTIFIAVPNCESKDAEVYRENWAGYDVPRHLWHFSQSTMSLLLGHHNLRLQKIIPMKLDAFYVSLLSEKYKNRKRNILSTGFSAIRMGVRSNIQAKRNNNYSSLIYVAQV